MATTTKSDQHGDHAQRVLIGIDASDNAEYALKFYMENLHLPENLVIFFHSTEPPYIGTGLGVAGYSFATGSQYDLMIGQRRSDVNKLRDRYIALLDGHDINYQLSVIEFGGNPGEAIAKAAVNEKVDLIVMGTRGEGKLRRTILGSVSDYVINHAHCPVLVCHKPANPVDQQHHHQHHQHHHHSKICSCFHYKKL